MTKKYAFRRLGLALLGALCAAQVSAQAADTDPYPPVKFDLEGQEAFVDSLKLDPARHEGPQSVEEKKTMLQDLYNDKVAVHAQSKHYRKGLTCTTCHDQQSVGTPDWMLAVTKPAIKQSCGDCHEVQKRMHRRTDTHAKIECTACHMPNMPATPAEYGKGPAEDGKYYNAVRRFHAYKINTHQGAQTFKRANDGVTWEYALDDKLRPFVDLQWSCGRATPGDYTLGGAGQGCHSPVTSTLDEGLRYANLGKIYEETLKMQAPVRAGYKKLTEALERQKLLLEATKLTAEQRTEVHLMLDKAQEVADEIKEDGSWGVHAPHYMKDRVETALGFVAKAQAILDEGGFDAKTRR